MHKQINEQASKDVNINFYTLMHITGYFNLRWLKELSFKNQSNEPRFESTVDQNSDLKLSA